MQAEGGTLSPAYNLPQHVISAKAEIQETSRKTKTVLPGTIVACIPDQVPNDAFLGFLTSLDVPTSAYLVRKTIRAHPRPSAECCFSEVYPRAKLLPLSKRGGGNLVCVQGGELRGREGGIE
jgi:hypothetical protein